MSSDQKEDMTKRRFAHFLDGEIVPYDKVKIGEVYYTYFYAGYAKVVVKQVGDVPGSLVSDVTVLSHKGVYEHLVDTIVTKKLHTKFFSVDTHNGGKRFTYDEFLNANV